MKKTTINTLVFVSTLGFATLCHAATGPEAQLAISQATSAQTSAVSARETSYNYLDEVVDPKHSYLVSDYNDYLQTHDPDIFVQSDINQGAAKKATGQTYMNDGQGFQNTGESKLAQANMYYMMGNYDLAYVRADEAKGQFQQAYGKYTFAYFNPYYGPDTGPFAEAVLWYFIPGQEHLDWLQAQ